MKTRNISFFKGCILTQSLAGLTEIWLAQMPLPSCRAMSTKAVMDACESPPCTFPCAQ